MSESGKALLLIAIVVCLALMVQPDCIAALTRRQSPVPKRVLSEAEMQLFTTTANTGEIVMVGTQGLLLDQGSQAVRVGTSAVTVLTNGLERMRVLNDGNVGIGTNGPVGHLHVSSDTSSTTSLYLGKSISANNEYKNSYFIRPNAYIDSYTNRSNTTNWGGDVLLHSAHLQHNSWNAWNNGGAIRLVAGCVYSRGNNGAAMGGHEVGGDILIDSGAVVKRTDGGAGPYAKGGNIMLRTGNVYKVSSEAEVNTYPIDYTTRLFISGDNGNVGINTTNPGSALHIVAPTVYSLATTDPSYPGNYQFTIGHTTAATGTTGLSAPLLGIGVNNTYGYFGAAYLQGVNPWFSTEVPILIQPRGGNVAIGHTQPGSRLHVYSPYSEICTLDSNASADCAVFRLTNTYGSNTNSLIFFQNSSNRSVEGGGLCATLRNDAGALRLQGAGGYDNANGITVLGNGNVGIGVANPGTPLHVEGSVSTTASSYAYISKTVNYVVQNSGTAQFSTSIYASNDIIANGSIVSQTVTAFSDIRLKKNIQPKTGLLQLLDKINLYSYDHIDQKKGRVEVGVIAQEIQEILPHCVRYGKNFLPNIYCLADSHQLSGDKVLVQVKNQSSIGDKVKVYFTNVGANQEKSHESTIHDCSSSFILVDKWENYSAEDELFVYGTEDPKVLTVDKVELAMAALGGVKELAEENRQLKERLSRLESLVSQLIR